VSASRRWALLLCLLPFAVAPGCFLPSYEHGPSGTAGSGNRGGSAGSDGKAGLGGDGLGGDAAGGSSAAGEGGGGRDSGEAGQSSAGAAGAAGAASDVVLAPREYRMEQGGVLEQSADQGLLVDDRNSGWVVITGDAPRGSDASSTRPAKYDAEFAIETSGAFRFEPVPEFFGVYEVRYQAGNADGERASGTLRVYVRPSVVTFEAVADGVGGFAVTGSSGEDFGASVSAAGDVDGDGFGDVLIGAPGAAAGDGAVYLVYGRAAPRSFEVDVDVASEPASCRIAGANGARLGVALAAVGDVNGDKLADFLVGAPGESLDDGRAYLVYGRARASFGAAPALAELLVENGGRELRGAPGENAGVLVGGGVDFTGDATRDLVIGGQQGRGRFYVVDGDVGDDLDLETGAAVLFLGAGQADLALAVATPGNVSGNNAQDLFVGTEKAVAVVRGPASAFPDNLGAEFQDADGVLLPRSSVGQLVLASAGDFDGDSGRDLAYCDEGLADPCLIVPNDPDNLAAGTQITGLSSGPAFVAGGGESSGDGFDDLLLAEPTLAHVVYGRAAPGPTLALDALGARGYSLTGAQEIAAVAFGGELDLSASDERAHYGDWLVADRAAENGAGRVYVLFGAPYSE
jgi:hypothetical protein